MRHTMATLVLAATCALAVAGCDNATVNAETTPPETMIPRPLVERELSGLLLGADQIDAAMGATGMAVTHEQSAMSDNSATMAPPECLALDGAGEATVFADSGFWAERDQSLNDGNAFTHYVKQAVVLFPTPEQAGAFLDSSAQRWSQCHQYTHVESGTTWSVGPLAQANHVLSTTTTMDDAAAPGWGCGRALAQQNNVIIDVNTCSAAPANTASDIADQIADNVIARW